MLMLSSVFFIYIFIEPVKFPFDKCSDKFGSSGVKTVLLGLSYNPFLLSIFSCLYFTASASITWILVYVQQYWFNWCQQRLPSDVCIVIKTLYVVQLRYV